MCYCKIYFIEHNNNSSSDLQLLLWILQEADVCERIAGARVMSLALRTSVTLAIIKLGSMLVLRKMHRETSKQRVYFHHSPYCNRQQQQQSVPQHLQIVDLVRLKSLAQLIPPLQVQSETMI